MMFTASVITQALLIVLSWDWAEIEDESKGYSPTRGISLKKNAF